MEEGEEEGSGRGAVSQCPRPEVSGWRQAKSKRGEFLRGTG